MIVPLILRCFESEIASRKRPPNNAKLILHVNMNKNEEIEQGKWLKNARNVFSVFVKKEDKKKKLKLISNVKSEKIVKMNISKLRVNEHVTKQHEMKWKKKMLMNKHKNKQDKNKIVKGKLTLTKNKMFKKLIKGTITTQTHTSDYNQPPPSAKKKSLCCRIFRKKWTIYVTNFVTYVMSEYHQ